MITKKVREELEAAVKNPGSYTKGSSLGKLRASFDSMCTQVCYSLTGNSAINRMMVRRCLNNIDKDSISVNQSKLVDVLHRALNTCEHTLHRKDYLDHSDSIKGFIENELESLMRELP